MYCAIGHGCAFEGFGCLQLVVGYSRLAEVCLAQNCLTQNCLVQDCPAQVCSIQVCPSQVCLSQANNRLRNFEKSSLIKELHNVAFAGAIFAQCAKDSKCSSASHITNRVILFRCSQFVFEEESGHPVEIFT